MLASNGLLIGARLPLRLEVRRSGGRQRRLRVPRRRRPALQAKLLVLFDIEFEDSGNMLLAETGGLAGGAGRIRLLDRGGTIRTVAGTGQQGFNGDLLKGTLTQLNFATGIAVDRCGNLLIADLGNGRLRQVRGAGSCSRR